MEKQLKSKPTINVFDSSENITDRINTIEEKLNKQVGKKHVKTKSADMKTPAINEAYIYIIGDSNTGKVNADILNNNIKCKKVWFPTFEHLGSIIENFEHNINTKRILLHL